MGSNLTYFGGEARAFGGDFLRLDLCMMQSQANAMNILLNKTYFVLHGHLFDLELKIVMMDA